MTASTASDIPADSWIDRRLPAQARPYARLMRLDRPIGTWLLLWPCWWSLTLAGAGFGSWWMYALFGLGAVLMRGAGCTYNDIVDRNYDAAVARTANRPLPSGQVTPFQAWVFLAAQALASFIILLQFNGLTVWLGIGSLALVATYPFMKRITYWPQAWLGLTFNWGALMGFSAVSGVIATPALILYLAGILWTLGYDTIYAHQDKEDDALIGVKSSALALGQRSKPFIGFCYALAALLVVVAVPMEHWNFGFFAAMGLAAAHLAWQVTKLDIDDPARCLKHFRSNRDLGGLVLLAILISRM
ncbi:MAG: 4-hydroxybenzoate octaprenyltransferase [Alphaproteobacteria bacterium]|nr:4-hydroxybenzoate octaprenyltransferase [Alphaproteobacteria bacterium]